MYRYLQESFFLRFVLATVIVFLTYNIEGFSFVHWVIENIGQLSLAMGVTAIILVLAWLALIRASIASLSIIGFALVAIACSLLAWWGINRLGLDINDKGAIIYIIELAIILLLSIGAPYSGIRRKFLSQSKDRAKDNDSKDKTSPALEPDQTKPEPTVQTPPATNTDTILLGNSPE